MTHIKEVSPAPAAPTTSAVTTYEPNIEIEHCLARAIAQNADDDLVEAPSAQWEIALGDALRAIALTVSGY